MRNARMPTAVTRHIGWTLAAALVAAPGAALAGPSLYDLTIFLTGVDPFAAAFYGPAPGVPVLPVVTPPPLVGVGRAAATAAEVPDAVVGATLAPGAAQLRSGRTFAGLALDRPYLVGNLGFSSMTDPTNSGTGVNNKWVLESGFVLQAAYGYRWTDRAATEIEIASRANGAKSVTRSGGAAVSATGNVAVVSILANATYEFPNQYRTTPYALGGLGFARYSALSVAAAGSSTVKSSDWVIGYQLGAGLVLPLDDRWALDVSCRFFATTQPELKNAAGVAFKTDVSTHNLLVGARFKL